MNDLSSNWHLAPQARAIIALCKEAEFGLATVIRAAWDEHEYYGLTDAADRKLDRLQALWTDAVNQCVGFTFAESQRDPSGGLSTQWVNASFRFPNIHVVLRDAFAARRQQEKAA